MSTQTSKPFMTYEQQANLLVAKKLDIISKDYTISLLKKFSYFALVSGYKHPFKQKKTKDYKPHSTIDDILELYNLDTKLRALFLKNILIIETHIKSLISYSFCEFHGDNQVFYLDRNNYRYATYPNETNKLISKLTRALSEANNYPYIAHQQNQYNNVPLWTLMNVLTLGIVSVMYGLLPQPMQIKVSKEFTNINEGSLVAMLDLLARVRNVCAHNERLFDYRYNKGSIKNTNIHVALKLPMKNNAYLKGKNDLFAVVIVLKYLLSKNEFLDFYNELEAIITEFFANTSILSQVQFYKYMGFPLNWKNIKGL